MSRDLPTIPEMLYARHWLFQGCPSAAKGLSPKVAVKILIQLIEALPSHISKYSYGSPEYSAALQEETQEVPEEVADSEDPTEHDFKSAVSIMRAMNNGGEPYAPAVYQMASVLAMHRALLEKEKSHG